MKNNNSSIRKLLFVFAFFLITISVSSAQTVVSKERILPIQAGTIEVNKGKATVVLNEQLKMLLSDESAKPSYFVVFTPYDNDVRVSISEKDNEQFSVDLSKLNSVKVDYVVFIKQTLLRLSNSTDAAISK